jgi:2-haloacid dehalogenase
MFGFSKPKRPKVVAFDVIGTLFPLEPLRPSIVALGMPPSGLEGWFAAGCRDVFAMAAAGEYQPFATVLEAALDQVLAEQGLHASTHDRKALVSQIEELDARAGTQEALAMLTSAGIPVMALFRTVQSLRRKNF